MKGNDPDADEPAKPASTSNDEPIEPFRSERVRTVPGGRVAVADMHAAYRSYCLERPLSLVRFGKIGAAVWRREKIGGRVYYLDVALIPLAVSA